VTPKQTIALWGDLKELLSDVLHVPQAALHVAVGLLLYPLFARWLGVRWGSWRPLWPILALELANEGIDIARYFVSRWPWSPAGTIYDLVLTMAPVALLVLACRRYRGTLGQMPQ
jgi:hypothetical protein